MLSLQDEPIFVAVYGVGVVLEIFERSLLNEKYMKVIKATHNIS